MGTAFAAVLIVLLVLLIGCSVFCSILAFRQHKPTLPLSSSSSSEGIYHVPFPARFITLYNIGAQTGITGAVTFDQQGQSSPGFVHDLGTSSVTLADNEKGVYNASFMVQPATGASSSNQFGLFVNGSQLAGSTYGVDSFDVPIVANDIRMRLYSGDVVTLENVTGSSVNLGAGSNDQVNASLSLIKISECE